MDYSKMSDFEINSLVSRRDSPRFPRNYCNNPADAWPIITENNISIILDNPTMPCATANARDLFDDADPVVHVAYDKPLRAAMVVYLMMQEAK